MKVGIIAIVALFCSLSAIAGLKNITKDEIVGKPCKSENVRKGVYLSDGTTDWYYCKKGKWTFLYNDDPAEFED